MYETFAPQRILQEGLYYITAILESEGLLYLATFDGLIHIINPAAAMAGSTPITTNLSGFFYTHAEINEITAPGNLPLLSDGFEVYLQGDTLVYVKDGCRLNEDTSPWFFLHIYPQEINDLPESRRAAGYNNLDFPFQGYGWFRNGRCVAVGRLPEYPIASIRTGQYHPADHSGGRIWEGSFQLGQ